MLERLCENGVPMNWPGQPRSVDHDGPGARGPAKWPYNAESCARHTKLKTFHKTMRTIVNISKKLKNKENVSVRITPNLISYHKSM